MHVVRGWVLSGWLVTGWLVTGIAITGSALAADALKPANVVPAVSELAARVKPSVAVITFDGRDGERQGLGTGFVIDPNGLIATNLHVIGEARPIKVKLFDGKTFDVVAVQASDRHHDLALLKIDATDLPALALGDSNALREGDSLVAIGNPHGLENSVVTGVLSGRRDVEGRPMLQISMPIERGNSGGPLLDSEGRVQGLITLKSLKTDNLGFAAPVNELKRLIGDPNPIPMSRWLTIGVLDPEQWTIVGGGRWKQRAGRILGEGMGMGFGARSLCLSNVATPELPFEVAVSVKFEPQDGAAGLVFHADGRDRHYGFYPSNGELRLSRFDGPDVYAWTVLQQIASPKLSSEGWNHLKVRVEPGRIRCYLNEELVIESTDAQLQSGKVGLCKFRQTQAEFRDFRMANQLPSREPTSELIADVRAVASELRLDQPPTLEHLSKPLANDVVTREALAREARLLEQRARRVRELAATLHERQVVDEFRKLVSVDDARIDLIRAALLVAAIDNPDVDVEAYVAEVERISRRIQSRLGQSASEQDRLEAIQRDLFQEQGFHGSRHDYGNRSNSYLNEVLDDREGLPITLAVLFMDVAARLNVPVVGIGLPGHFVVRYQPATGEGRLIDVFDHGRLLSVEDAKRKVTENTDGEWDDAYLTPLPRRKILIRLLRNLFAEARAAEEAPRLLRYCDLLLVLDETSVQDRFYRAVLSLQTQRFTQARADTDWLLDQSGGGVSRRALEDLSSAIDRARQQEAP